MKNEVPEVLSTNDKLQSTNYEVQSRKYKYRKGECFVEERGAKAIAE